MKRIGLAALGLVALGFVGPMRPAGGIVGHAQRPAVVPAELMQRAVSQGTIRVIVQLDVASQPEGGMAAQARALQRQAIAARQNQLFTALAPRGYRLARQFNTIPFVALELTPAAVAALELLPNVRAVTEDRLGAISLTQSVPLVQGPQAWSAGYDGAGWAVAILDTGVDKNHSFLSGKVVEEACYSGNSNCPNGLTSQIGSGAGVPCTYAAGGCRHGTHVAGIAAGQGSTFSGVAKGASVIAIQVFSRFTGANCASQGEDPCTLTYFSDLMAGLERVYTLRTTRQIAAANMSLGGGKYTSTATCDASNAGLKAAIDNLRSAGIASVISSGNNGYSDGLQTPACISSAISVGSTTKSDLISSFSNSASFLSLLAPGASINSSVPGGGFAFFSGTSMAAPHVTGAWAIGKQKTPAASVATLLASFRTSNIWITDPRNGFSFPRLEIATALGLGSTAPMAFGKTAPANGATGQSTSPTISWTASTGATSYEYCIDTINNAQCDNGWGNAGGVTSIGVTGLPPGVTFYWQMRARNASGTTEANGGTWWSFATAAAAPGAFSKTTPANGATGQSTSLTFTWGASSGATSYEYCYDPVNNNSCDGSWNSVGGATSVMPSGLTTNNTTYWQVRAINGGGTTYANGSATAYWSFTTQPAAPFTDDPLTSGTVIKLVHITELRTRINAVRARYPSLQPYPWADGALVARTTVVRAQHILEMRQALLEAYKAAGRTPLPSYSTTPQAGVPIRVADIAELRAALRAIE